MIATILQGGLGNQMFMYAMVRAMAWRNNTMSVFNKNYGFEHDYTFRRKLELQCLNVCLDEKPIYTFDYSLGRYTQHISKILNRNVLVPNCLYVKEVEPLHFQEELISKEWKNVFLEGYWQSERYFFDYKDRIRKEFVIKMPLEEDVKYELRDFSRDNENLVLVGIRRYQECNNLQAGVLLDEDYYNKAINIIESKIENPKYIVFSQQQEWAKEHFKTKNPICFVKPKEGEFNSIKDLYLMIHCKHAIISNSSYYWWGAWLSKTNDGIVIAPSNFLNKDTVCEKWLKI